MTFKKRGGRGSGGRWNGRRGGSFSGRNRFDQELPTSVTCLGYYSYSCQDNLICKVQIEDVPFFNAFIYLENKQLIGKIDEIFGNVKDYFVSIKLNENVKASSLPANKKLFIDSNRIIPLSKFLPKLPNIKKKTIGSGSGRGGGKGTSWGRGRREFRGRGDVSRFSGRGARGRYSGGFGNRFGGQY